MSHLKITNYKKTQFFFTESLQQVADGKEHADPSENTKTGLKGPGYNYVNSNELIQNTFEVRMFVGMANSLHVR
jgi:hypothetical protein